MHATLKIARQLTTALIYFERVCVLVYKIKKEALGLLEKQSEKGNIDLYYGDATQVSEEG